MGGTCGTHREMTRANRISVTRQQSHPSSAVSKMQIYLYARATSASLHEMP